MKSRSSRSAGFTLMAIPLIVAVVAIGLIGIRVYAWYNTKPKLSTTTSPHFPSNIHWLIAAGAAKALELNDGTLGKEFVQSINNSTTYEIAGDTSDYSLSNATYVRSFESYQAIVQAFTQDKIPANVKVILYDNENWTGTPQVEQQQPFTYVPMVEKLVHQNGKLFMNSPAADLTKVLDPSAPDNYTGYLHENLADLAQYSDIFEIQAQNAASASQYVSFARQAVEEARKANSSATILLGITAHVGNSPSAQDIVDEVQATKSLVSGYWLNIPGAQPSAEQVQKVLPLLQALTSSQ